MTTHFNEQTQENAALNAIALSDQSLIDAEIASIEGFLYAICPPAADELKLMAKTAYSTWRLHNILAILRKVKQKLEHHDSSDHLQINPRLTLCLIEHCSLCSCENLQWSWANFLISCLDQEPGDDSNIMLIHILKQLTFAQIEIIFYICQQAKISHYKTGLNVCRELFLKETTLHMLMNWNGNSRMILELEHLYSLNLIVSKPFEAFNSHHRSLKANVTPTALALHLYIRLQGFCADPYYFWHGYEL